MRNPEISVIFSWVEKSITAILSHYDTSSKLFLRTSESQKGIFYPTATFHAINALTTYLRLSNLLDRNINLSSNHIRAILKEVLESLVNEKKDNWMADIKSGALNGELENLQL